MSDQANVGTYEEEKRASRELLRSLDIDTQKMDEVKSKDMLTFSKEMVQDNALLSKEDFSSLPVSDSIKESLYMLGYDRPSVAQLSTIPHILNGENLMFQSKSGTGKTISFVVGTLQKVVVGKGVQVLLITPTMELNRQTKTIFDKVGGRLGIRTFMAMRGERVSFVDAEVLIGSPGALLNAIRALRIEQINTLIVDEADAVLDPEGMGAQTKRILDMVRFEQFLFFSATYSERIKTLILKYVQSIRDCVEPVNTKPDDIGLYHLKIHDRREKMNVLMYLYELLVVGQSIIFVSTKRMAEILKKRFEADLNRIGILHGDLSPEERGQITEEFRHAKTKILISTDVFSRGMDIPQVNLVINYDLPVYHNNVDVSTYIHSIGRCGRFGRKGFVIDFVCGGCEMGVVEELGRKLGCGSKGISVEALSEVSGEGAVDGIGNGVGSISNVSNLGGISNANGMGVEIKHGAAQGREGLRIDVQKEDETEKMNETGKESNAIRNNRTSG